jgi:hypothetical protein
MSNTNLVHGEEGWVPHGKEYDHDTHMASARVLPSVNEDGSTFETVRDHHDALCAAVCVVALALFRGL